MSADPQHCPLCQGANQCARAADPAARHCWCQHQAFPTPLPSLPANRCLCQACAEKLRLAEAARR